MLYRLIEIDPIRLNLHEFAHPVLPLEASKPISLFARPCGHIIPYLIFPQMVKQSPTCGQNRRTCIATAYQLSPAPSSVILLVVTNKKNKKNSPAVMARHEAYFNLANAQTLP